MIWETKWGWKTSRIRIPGLVRGLQQEMSLNVHLAAVPEFARGASQEGSPIKIFGRVFGSADAVPIPHTFWMTNHFEATQVFSDSDRCETNASVWAQPGYLRYEGMKIDREGVRAVWPPLDPIRRWLLQRESWKEWKQYDRIE